MHLMLKIAPLFSPAFTFLWHNLTYPNSFFSLPLSLFLSFFPNTQSATHRHTHVNNVRTICICVLMRMDETDLKGRVSFGRGEGEGEGGWQLMLHLSQRIQKLDWLIINVGEGAGNGWQLERSVSSLFFLSFFLSFILLLGWTAAAIEGQAAGSGASSKGARTFLLRSCYVLA